jgi:DMSO/TMAO reductase YedYZ molybdopterin-dependent catalytic subunit
MSPANMLCYEMNGVPLPAPHGFSVRLITPRWYGVSNVKWLKRIEVRDTRFMGRFMARDYVTIREGRTPTRRQATPGRGAHDRHPCAGDRRAPRGLDGHRFTFALPTLLD